MEIEIIIKTSCFSNISRIVQIINNMRTNNQRLPQSLKKYFGGSKDYFSIQY
jgi:hypothetical protein